MKHRNLLLRLALIGGLLPGFALSLQAKQVDSASFMLNKAAAAAQLEADIEEESNDMYQLLVAEFSASAGDYNTAFEIYFQEAGLKLDPHLYQRAVALAIKSKNGFNAVRAAQAWVQRFPDSLDANKMMVRLLIGLNQLTGLPKELKAASDHLSEPDLQQYLQDLQTILATTTQPKVVLNDLNTAFLPMLDKPAMAPYVATLTGYFNLKAGNAAVALNMAKLAAKTMPNLTNLAELELLLMQYPGTKSEATELFRLYLNTSKNQAMWLRYVNELIEQDNWLSAYSEAKNLVQQYPKNMRAWFILGGFAMAQGKEKEAQTAFDTFVNLKKTADEEAVDDGMDAEQRLNQAYVWLAQINVNQKKYGEAFKALNEMTDMTNVQSIVLRAYLLDKEKQTKEAINTLKTLTVDKENSNKLAVQLIETIEMNKSPVDVARLLSRYYGQIGGKADADTIFYLAAYADRRHWFDIAQILLTRMIAMAPNSAQAYNMLGYMLVERGQNLDYAQMLLEKAMAISPNDAFIMDSMGWLKYRQGKLTDAIKLLKQAVRREDDPEISAHLGDALWKNGQRDEAIKVLTDASKRYPENGVLQEVMGRVGILPPRSK